MTAPSWPRHVGIVGLGLIGGSLARDLLDRGVRVTAWDPALDGRALADDPVFRNVAFAATVTGVLAAPLVAIAVPVDAALEVLDALAAAVTGDHVVFDVGSTKAEIVSRAERLGIASRFVGCHPLAGDHRAGLDASRHGMFAGAPVYLCPSGLSEHAAIATTRALWESLRARPIVADSMMHDRMMAYVSHLPHLASVALALALDDCGYARSSLGPGGRDVTRLAGGSPEVWLPIVTQNRDAIAAALAAVERRLGSIRRALLEGDARALDGALRTAAAWHGE